MTNLTYLNIFKPYIKAMAVEYGEGKKPNLIEDIVPAHHTGYIDVRDPKVRYQSIGHLDEQYLRSRNLGGAVEAAPVEPAISSGLYTRIPPLSTWPSFAKDNIPFFALISVKLRDLISSARMSMAASIAGLGSIKSIEADWLPKKYSALKGSYTDWDLTALTGLKWFAPVVILVLIIIMLLLSLPDAKVGVRSGSKNLPSHNSISSNNQGSNNNNSGGAKTASANNPASNQGASASSGSALSASGNSLGGVSSGSGYSSLPYVSSPLSGTTTYTAPTYTTGGLGGGSVPATIPAPSGTTSGGTSSGGPVPTTTVTVPSLNLSSGGKTLLGTSGPSLTLN